MRNLMNKGWLAERQTAAPSTATIPVDEPLSTGTGSGSIRVVNRDTLTGTTTLGGDQDIYEGTAGRHTGQVHGGAENDLLFGGFYSDNLFGGNGNDVIVGGGGDDFIDGGAGSDTLDGGAGFDTLSFLTSLTRAVVDLGQGTATSAGRDRVQGFERVVGSAFADQITGSVNADILEGRHGADTLAGGGGADTLIGGRGNDVLTGGDGADRIVFSSGDGEDVVTDFHVGQDLLVLHGYTAYQELRQVGADTLVILSGQDSLLLRGVTASSLTSTSFEFHQSPLADPIDPLLPTPSVTTARETVSDVLVYADETQVIQTSGLFYGYTLTGDSSRGMPNGGFYAPSLFNAGAIIIADDRGAYGIRTSSNGGQSHLASIVNMASGQITVEGRGTDSQASGYSGSDGSTSSFFNFGSMTVSAGGFATAVSLYQALAISVVNEGSVTVTAANARGFSLSGDVSFWNTGSITVDGGTIGRGVTVDNNVDVFVNSGTITVEPGQFGSIGLEVGAGQGLSYIYNDGIIEATTAVQALSYVAINPYVLNNDHFYNTGELRGKVIFAQGRDELYNTGLITGSTTLGEGDDLYDGRGGTQLGGVRGEAGADTLLGGTGVDHLFGDEGDDYLAGGGGNDVLTGGDGRDTFHFTAGDGRDIITDFNAANGEVIRITGYAQYQSMEQVGADVRIVLSSSDSLLLEGVTLASVTSANFVFGAVGLAAAEVVPARPVAPQAPTSPGMLDARPSPIIGQDGADTLAGTNGDDVIHGMNGSDQISGGLGNDDLLGGAGADVFSYTLGDGMDVVHDFSAADGDIIRLNGVVGEDVGGFVIQGYPNNITRITFRDGGTLTITNTSPVAVRAALQLGSPPGFRVQEGGEGGDLLVGSDVSDLLRGNGGSDRLQGLDGNDIIEGGSGDDTIEGGRGDDELSGGAGADVFIIRPGDGADTILDFNAAEGDILLLEGFSLYNTNFIDFRNIIIQLLTNQTVTLNGVNNLASIQGSIRIGPAEPTAPSIAGTSSGDRIVGTSQAERIAGGNGGDIIEGGGGSDIIDGGAGDDTISGDAGLDMLTGGSGADIFLFRPGSHNDIITDFNGADGDRLRLEGYRSYSIIDVSGGVFVSVTQDFTGEEGTIFIQGGTRASVEPYLLLVPDEVPLPNFEFDRYGTPGADVLIGDTRSEVILGGAGNDRLDGRGGPDLVEGGDGDDIVMGGDGDDLLNGGTGTDIMTGGSGRDWFAFYAGDGRDTITDFNVAEDVIDVGFQLIASIAQSGSDTVITLQSGDQLTLTGILASSVKVGNFVRTLTTPPLVPSQDVGGEPGGTPGADFLTGTAGADTLDGLDGDDVITGGLGNDTINGDAGTDTAVFAGNLGSYSFSSGPNGSLIVTGADGSDTLTSIERVRFDDGTYVLATGHRYFEGGAGADTVTGTNGRDELRGLDGDDILNGLDGDDYLIGGAGNDTIDGGAGADMAIFAGSITSYTINTVPSGAVSVAGVNGTDIVRNVERFQFDDGIFILASGYQYVEGSNNAETIIGSFRSDEIYGLGGNDIIDAAGAADTVFAGLGDDVITGGSGNDYIDGGEGTDTAVFSGNLGSYSFSSGPNGGLIVTGADGSDTLISIERVRFDEGTYVLATGHRYFEGGAGADTVTGTNGRDELRGLDGDDILNGLDGDDYLIGGAGSDTIDGGAGADMAIFSGSITNYTITSVAGGVSVAGVNGTDIVRNVERFQFDDGIFILASGYQYVEGSNNAETILGSFRSDEIHALGGDDIINAGDADDTIIGGLGNDTIDGGAGTDLAVFSGLRSAYTITQSGGQTLVVGADGSDTLINVERLLFSDGIYDITGNPLAAPAVETLPLRPDDADKAETGPQVLPGAVDDILAKDRGEGPQVLPGVSDVQADKGGDALPLVWPGALDDDFLPLKPDTDSVGPQIQPGAAVDFDHLDTARLEGGRMDGLGLHRFEHDTHLFDHAFVDTDPWA